VQSFIYAVLTASTMTLLLSIIFFLYHNRESITFGFYASIIIILSMMASMLDSLTFYIIEPKSFLNSVIAINISMEVMSIAIASIAYFGSQNKFRYKSKYDMIISLLVVWNEVSMAAFLYSLIYPPGKFQLFYIVKMLSVGLGFYYFIIPMLIEMSYLALIINNRIKRIKMITLLIASISPPTLFGDSAMVNYLIIVLVLAMSVAFLILFWEGRIRMNIETNFLSEFKTVIILLVMMFIATVIGATDISEFYILWLPYGLVTVISMIYYLYIAADRGS